MNFSFNDLGTTSFTNESTNYLKPYEIYAVKLTKIEKGTVTGKSDGTVYQTVAIEFTGEEGVFSTNLFLPNKDSDFERNENPNTHKLQPSAFDRFQFTLMQIAEAINPSGAQKIKDNASKLKTIDQFVDLVIKALNGKNDVEVFLKLTGRNVDNKTFANLPSACWFDSKDNKCKPLNFISSDKSKLNFSAYEIQQANAYKNAKPTNMDAEESKNNEEENDLDISGIEL